MVLDVPRYRLILRVSPSLVATSGVVQSRDLPRPPKHLVAVVVVRRGRISGMAAAIPTRA